MMHFHLNDEQMALSQLAREVAREKAAPLAEQIDRNAEYPQELFRVFRETGLLAVAVPEEYGGAGLGTLGLVLAVEEMAKVCCSAGLMLLLTRLPLAPIMFGGTEAQKRRYAGATATGEMRGAFCLSEPGAGSDAANISTRAVRRGGRYIINGTKNWISGAAQADFFTVAVKTDPAAGARGMSVFVVEKGTPGLTVGPKERKMGVRGVPVNQVIFEEVEVPAANMLGAENRGFSVIMQTLNSVRPVVAARGLGLAQGALGCAVEYARQRETFGKPIIEHQGLQWMMAELATQIEAARLLTYRAATLVDEGKAGRETAHFLSMAKWFSTEVAQKAATDAIQFMGAAGYMEDYPLERFYRDVKQLTIVEGTTQIQKGIIARAIAEGSLSW